MALSSIKGTVQELLSTLADTTNNWLSVSLGSRFSGEDQTTDVLKVENRYAYANIATATTTVVKSGSGFLHTLTVNTTAAGTITIYDSTAASGNKIGTLKASVVEQTFTYDVALTTGLTIVTAGASDVSVSYR